MQLSELLPVNRLLHDPAALAARYQHDGCLLIRRAIRPSALAGIADQVASVLERWGVAHRREGIRWTGMPLAAFDLLDLDRVPALADLVGEFETGLDPLSPIAAGVCGKLMHLWRGAHIFAAFPDDPSHVTPPHQDAFAMNATGDYRRLWIALGDIPFGDGGLGVAVGSHRLGRLPIRELPEFTRRRAPESSLTAPQPTQGIDPALVDDHWHTAAMEPGDLVVFHTNLVHRGLPATSDRIRTALAVVASAQSDPRPPVTYTTPEGQARRERVQELAAPLGLSDEAVNRIFSDLCMSGMDVTEHTVHAASHGEYSRWRRHAPAALAADAARQEVGRGRCR